MRNRVSILPALIFFCVMGRASATVVGTLDVHDCTGGGVTVTTSSVIWLQSAGPGVGCLTTGLGTNVTGSGGLSLATGVNGTINNLTGSPAAMIGFMTFPTVGPLAFDLTFLGPGSSSTACAASMAATGPACSVISGSPFILTPNGTGTTVTLPADGVVKDPNAPSQISTWSGAFTIIFPNLAPLDIQNFYLGMGNPALLGNGCVNGSCTMMDTGVFAAIAALESQVSDPPGYTGTFTISGPEPISMLLSAVGLVFLGARAKRAK